VRERILKIGQYLAKLEAKI